MSNKRGQSRVLCFKNKAEAVKCRNYTIFHKRKYGYWPSFDMTNQSSVLEYKTEKILKMKEIYPSVEILEINNDIFQRFLSKQCTDFLFCHEFDYNVENNTKFDINFTGEEILNSCTSFEKVKHLNNSFAHD